MNRHKLLGAVPIVAGMLLQSVLIFKSADPFGSFTLGLFAGSCAGYVFCLLALALRSNLPAVLGACFALAADALLYNEVFVHPHGSMSALGLLGVPVVNAILAILGIVIGWIALKVAGRQLAGDDRANGVAKELPDRGKR